MNKTKTFIIVSSQTPKIKNKKKGNVVMKEISHIVEKGKNSRENSKESSSSSKESPESKTKTIDRTNTEPEILNNIIEMEKQVIEIIQTTNNLKVECFKCMDCFKDNKDNKADLKATIV